MLVIWVSQISKWLPLPARTNLYLLININLPSSWWLCEIHGTCNACCHRLASYHTTSISWFCGWKSGHWKKKKRDQILKHCNTTHLYIIHHTSMRTKQHRLHKTSTWAQAPAQIYQTLWIHSSTGISDLGLVVKDSWLFNPTIVCLVVLSLTPSGPHFWGAWTILIFNCRNISLHVFFML